MCTQWAPEFFKPMVLPETENEKEQMMPNTPKSTCNLNLVCPGHMSNYRFFFWVPTSVASISTILAKKSKTRPRMHIYMYEG